MAFASGKTSERSREPEEHRELARILWRLEDSLASLVFSLTAQRWALERDSAGLAGEAPLLPEGLLDSACRDVGLALDRVQRRDLLRASRLSRLGMQLGFGPEPALADLCVGLPPPVSELAAGHHLRLRGLLDEMLALAGANRVLVSAALRHASSELDRPDTCTASNRRLDALGRALLLRDASSVLDRARRCTVITFVGPGWTPSAN